MTLRYTVELLIEDTEYRTCTSIKKKFTKINYLIHFELLREDELSTLRTKWLVLMCLFFSVFSTQNISFIHLHMHVRVDINIIMWIK